MIKSFSHKGVKKFFETGNTSGIQKEHSSKLERILDRLDVATAAEDMNLPGYDLHEMKMTGPFRGKPGHWAVSVSGAWRVTFKFDGKDVVLVDYMNYH